MVAKLISTYKTASRCWIPVNQNLKASIARNFSSRQRCVNFNNISSHNVVANDDVLAAGAGAHATGTSSASAEEYNFETFEPSIFSSEEIHTAGPVRRHE
ncbi:uncharacterized protein CANTADRAFT_6740 [Suhomyces tanzawaensis NRRL Y-17324]|uniref:Uncharacterized protein n=1 Tax=Suhomyces tanzawaensis NRRL Y-17324 TaxID=984487 RepID=A0A1E4SFU0_9ASCO|nr:uncharacterized protein CANTADRAFT_6740 [Suhomyces tanzawaensis NRRL Y-17324]ODV78346.1 hypothetical protein CANTADRAFT_6740 [Suhomyces tanzawaensis NRRL Y-17324]